MSERKELNRKMCIKIVGNVYPVRDRIKKLDGIWDGRCWWVPERWAEKAQGIVNEVTPSVEDEMVIMQDKDDKIAPVEGE